ncbi:hypothetical protein KA013_03455 [Patescibacteria group bacterium]|nr:hypothetical protein [Patescibacteria group bacterium]
MNAVLFRENIEDLYSGHELPAQDAKTIKLIRQMNEEFDRDIPDFSSIGIKNMSQYNTNRISKAAADYAIKNDYKLMTYMHK